MKERVLNFAFAKLFQTKIQTLWRRTINEGARDFSRVIFEGGICVKIVHVESEIDYIGPHCLWSRVAPGIARHQRLYKQVIRIRRTTHPRHPFKDGTTPNTISLHEIVFRIRERARVSITDLSRPQTRWILCLPLLRESRMIMEIFRSTSPNGRPFLADVPWTSGIYLMVRPYKRVILFKY